MIAAGAAAFGCAKVVRSGRDDDDLVEQALRMGGHPAVHVSSTVTCR